MIGRQKSWETDMPGAKKRVYGDVLDVSPPKPLPRWMLAPDYQPQSEPRGRGDVSVSPNRTPPPTSTPAQDSYGPMYSFSDIDLNSSVLILFFDL